MIGTRLALGDELYCRLIGLTPLTIYDLAVIVGEKHYGTDPRSLAALTQRFRRTDAAITEMTSAKGMHIRVKTTTAPSAGAITSYRHLEPPDMQQIAEILFEVSVVPPTRMEYVTKMAYGRAIRNFPPLTAYIEKRRPIIEEDIQMERNTFRVLQRRRQYERALQVWSLVDAVRATIQNGAGNPYVEIMGNEWKQRFAPITQALAPLPHRNEEWDVINALLWMVRTEKGWSDLPKRFPHPKTIKGRLDLWRRSGVWEQIEAGLNTHLHSLADVETALRIQQGAILDVAREPIVPHRREIRRRGVGSVS